MKRAISDVVATIERNLLMDPTIDTNFSGTTLVLTIIRGHSITIANIGDSRITLGRKSDKSGDRSNSKSALSPMLAIPLSVDHKPDIPKEKERILRNGGRVFAVEYEDGCKGPERVWLSNMNIPGLAMSRSLCDQVAHSVGVSSVPEFFERSLDPSQDAVLIIATDGLWEFISDQEAIDIVATAAEPSAAVNALIREATARWLVNEKVVDDISICVAFLLGFSADCVILDCQDNLHDIREENV
jgi:serine/threonine protein phosphatase PrpC